MGNSYNLPGTKSWVYGGWSIVSHWKCCNTMWVCRVVCNGALSWRSTEPLLRWPGPLTSSQCGTVHVSVNCAYVSQEVYQQHTWEVAKMVASTLSVGGVCGFAGMFPLIGWSLTGGSEMMNQNLTCSNDLLQEVILFYCIIFRDTATDHHFYCFLTDIVLKHIQHNMLHSAVG